MRISGFMSFRSLFVAAALAGSVAVGGTSAMANGPVSGDQAVTQTESLTAKPQAKAPEDTNPAQPIGPERRIALVIGNSAYENVSRLPNPANDAKAMSQFLNSAGFEVIAANDLTQDEMIQVLQDFSAKVSERGPNTVAFVYYAGHGVQIAGDNYLIPVDAKINTEADLPNEAVRLVDVMATLQAVPSRMRMVVLDACRNNPFTQLKDTGRGLAMVDAPNGSIVGYSTAPGTEALDGNGSNSPYTSAFLRVGREKNLPIEQLFKKVRLAVNDATDGQQTPWESSSLTSDFYFFGDTQNAMASMVAPAASRPRVVASNTIRTRTPREAYALAVQEDSPEYYEEFVRVYPQDPFADRIRRLLATRLLSIAWHGAVIANSPTGYKNFYSQYSNSPYANIAQKLENQPKLLPLYQPTKIIVPQQLAPQIKLTNFNGASVPQGSNSPLNWIATKKASMGQTPLNNGVANGGLPGKGNALPLPTNGQTVTPIKAGPGVDLAKNGPRLETRLDNKRVTTLPQVNQHQQGRDNPVKGIKNDPKAQINTNGGRANIGTRFERRQAVDVAKPVRTNSEMSRVGRRPAGQVVQNQSRLKQVTTTPSLRPAPRVINTPVQSSGSSRSSRTVSMNSGGSFGGGGGGFGRSSFR